MDSKSVLNVKKFVISIFLLKCFIKVMFKLIIISYTYYSIYIWISKIFLKCISSINIEK